MSETKLSKFANKEVLEFYRSLPFNYYSDINQQIDSVKNGMTNIAANGSLDEQIKNSKRIIDIGCGAGWLSNSISYLYKGKKVTGVDFNSVAINRAAEVAKTMSLSTEFHVDDLFNFKPNQRYDFLISIGVLMCTNDCMKAIKSVIQNCLTEKGKIYIGLYHLHGRKPFLNYFKNLQSKGYSNDELLREYSKIHTSLKDKTHLESWFRDQVLHPHETLHTMEEIMPILESENMILTSTSINKFEKINYVKNKGYDKTQLQSIFEKEKKMKEASEKALIEKRYYPGFFTFFAERK